MSVKAIEDVLSVAKAATVAIIQAVQKDGFQRTDLMAFLASPEFNAAVQKAVPEAGEVVSEALNLGIMDDLELGRFIYGAVTDIVRELKATQGVAA